MGGERRVLHVDMDAYFAALEVQAQPVLKGKPLVIGALPENRGVVSCASYEAREFGIRAGMPAAQAKRLCPQAVFVPCHPALYIHTSRRILDHLLEFTPLVEMYSIDEAFVDVTDMLSGDLDGPTSWKQLEKIAREISGSVERALNLSCSVGVGPNRLVAKMASEVQKPRGVTLLGYEAFRHHFWPKSVDNLYGVGDKTAASLMIYGIETIRDLAETPFSFLKGRFGVFGEALHFMAWGQDDSPVVPSHETPAAKSLGHEHTVQRDVATPEEALALLMALAERVGEDLRKEGYAGKRIMIKIRYSDFSTLTRQKMIRHSTNETRDIYRIAQELFRANYCGGDIRLLGVNVGELVRTEGCMQLGLFPEDERYRKLLETLDRIRDTFGRESIFPAGVMRTHVAPAEAVRERAAPTPARNSGGNHVGRRKEAASAAAASEKVDVPSETA
jgi:DNA polymerase-4